MGFKRAKTFHDVGYRGAETGHRGYTEWSQVAGYFDGDGCVLVKLLQFMLVFYLEWADCSISQLAQINRFLKSHGIMTAKLYRIRTQNAYHLRISRKESVLLVCKKMLPYAFKKKAELRLVTEYYENQITANECIAKINDRVVEGSRAGKILKGNLPLTYLEGAHRARRRSKLKDSEVAEIVNQYVSGNSTIENLSRMYRKSRSTIRKMTKEFG